MSEKMPREQIALLKNVIEDLQERVQTASESIDAIVQALDEQHDEAAQPDFERLRYESEKQAYKGHPAARSTIPELYFLLLVSVLTAADATEAQCVTSTARRQERAMKPMCATCCPTLTR